MDIKELKLGDEGKYQIVLKNKIGEVAQEATLSLARKFFSLFEESGTLGEIFQLK